MYFISGVRCQWCIRVSLLVQGPNSILENQSEWAEVVVAIQVLGMGPGSRFRDVVAGPQGGVYCLDSSEIFVNFHLLKLFFLAHFIPLSPAAQDPWQAGSPALTPCGYSSLIDMLPCPSRKHAHVFCCEPLSLGMLWVAFISRGHVQSAWILGFHKAVVNTVYLFVTARLWCRCIPTASTTAWLQI